jgi:Rrf2 family protein
VKRNSRLSLALHTLAHMAADPQQMQTSAQIAAHAGTNPVVVRRVLGHLRAAGLLVSEKGHAGGWKLARPAQQISLADVYLALGERLVFTEDSSGAGGCAVENALHHKVTALMQELEHSLTTRLSQMTILDLGAEHP